ncbi:MAG: GNAT family N-acetyltransferase [Streptosporangiaceae bacterium]
MDDAALRATFDEQVRRRTGDDGSGARAEADGAVVRQIARGGDGWSGITWSDLDGTAGADRVIAAQVRYFAGLGLPFEWKLHDYDQPPDLGDRLTAAGFVPDAEEAVMVAEMAGVPADVTLPEGVTLRPVATEADVGLLIQVHERVFGRDQSRLHSALLAQWREAPASVAMVLAMAGDEPVCGARVDLPAGTEFAGLWGGGTLPPWRGRGIYRALVAYRAGLAARRGYRYLTVDASADSEPILRRLGFRCLARTTPYQWATGTGA